MPEVEVNAGNEATVTNVNDTNSECRIVLFRTDIWDDSFFDRNNQSGHDVHEIEVSITSIKCKKKAQYIEYV